MSSDIHNAEMLKSVDIYQNSETPTLAAFRISTESGDHFFLVTKAILDELTILTAEAANKLEPVQ